MKFGFAQGLNTIAVLCAVTVTVLVVRQQISGVGQAKQRTVRMNDSVPDQPVANWDQVRRAGHRIGPDAAPVKIVEFADFECPFCGNFQNHTWRAVRAAFGDTVQLVFRHWPLSYHRFAFIAARASECAGAQGRFVEFHDLLYAQQDSLGLKSFDDFASQAGVPDLTAFKECYKSTARVPAIDSDIAAAHAVGATGTPALVLDGRLLGFVPDSAELARLIRAELATPDASH